MTDPMSPGNPTNPANPRDPNNGERYPYAIITGEFIHPNADPRRPGSPSGDFIESGTVIFSRHHVSVSGRRLIAPARDIYATITDGVMEQVQLAEGIWKVEVQPTDGALSFEFRFEVIGQETIDLSKVARIYTSPNGVHYTKGEEGAPGKPGLSILPDPNLPGLYLMHGTMLASEEPGLYYPPTDEVHDGIYNRLVAVDDDYELPPKVAEALKGSDGLGITKIEVLDGDIIFSLSDGTEVREHMPVVGLKADELAQIAAAVEAADTVSIGADRAEAAAGRSEAARDVAIVLQDGATAAANRADAAAKKADEHTQAASGYAITASTAESHIRLMGNTISTDASTVANYVLQSQDAAKRAEGFANTASEAVDGFVTEAELSDALRAKANSATVTALRDKVDALPSEATVEGIISARIPQPQHVSSDHGVATITGPNVMGEEMDAPSYKLFTNPLAQSQNRPIKSLDYDPVTNSVFSGYGDWGLNGDHIGVVAYSLDTGEVTTLFEPVYSEAVERVVRLGDALYVPHIDGKGYWESCGYATDEGGTWHEVTLPGTAVHIFDMAKNSQGMWACGSRLNDEGQGQATVWHRPNGGEWRIETSGPVGDLARYRSFVVDGDVVTHSERALDPWRVPVMDGVTMYGSLDGGVWAQPVQPIRSSTVDLPALNNAGLLTSPNVLRQIKDIAKDAAATAPGGPSGAHGADCVIPTLPFKPWGDLSPFASHTSNLVWDEVTGEATGVGWSAYLYDYEPEGMLYLHATVSVADAEYNADDKPSEQLLKLPRELVKGAENANWAMAEQLWTPPVPENQNTPWTHTYMEGPGKIMFAQTSMSVWDRALKITSKRIGDTSTPATYTVAFRWPTPPLGVPSKEILATTGWVVTSK